MAKSRNNLLGVGGQRKKLSRADQHGNPQGRSGARRTADDQKRELLRKMRERAQVADTAGHPADTTGRAAEGAGHPAADVTATTGPADPTATGRD
ncbi:MULTISPECIES: DUF6243 family protein [unclassified Streptomyces]|uniref:DUF6243 family protein n=1 Tax=unclassified Streptomyces TaxID=2593676 RepID=UPI0038208C9E